MRAALLACVICSMAAEAALAQQKPYEAIVDVDVEPVRSGPSTRYYVTSEVVRGTKVMVHRHDPGGWYMISPPQGSFSWIRAEHVQRGVGSTAQVITNNAIVRVGTEKGDDPEVWQRSLSKGDTVEILGEQAFQTSNGPVQMLKIRCPDKEYRWIAGKAVVRADAVSPVSKKKPDEASFAADPEKPGNRAGDVVERPMVKSTAPQTAARRTVPAAPEMTTFRDQLAQIDDRFREMIKSEPAQWDLAALERDYQTLKTSSMTPAQATQLQQRMQAVTRYARIQQESGEVTRLTKETRERDAQLLAGSMGQPAQANGTGFATPPAVANVTQPTAPPTSIVLAGAGILQKSAATFNGAPPYVLLASDNRVLAYLVPAPGLDLAPMVGRPIGVVGERAFRQDLQADAIQVRQLVPVRLKPQTR